MIIWRLRENILLLLKTLLVEGMHGGSEKRESSEEDMVVRY